MCGAFLFMEEKLLCHILILRDLEKVTEQQIVKQFVSAYEWDKERGPVICFCNRNAYEYLLRNDIDEKLYIDVIVHDQIFSEEKAKEIIGGDEASIEFFYPFLPPFYEDIDLLKHIYNLPENYKELCNNAITKEHILSSI